MGQHKTKEADSNWSYADLVYTDQVNGMDLFATDSINRKVQQIVIQNNIKVPDDENWPKVYFTNIDNEKYFQIWGGPDLGYGWFYTIGYTDRQQVKNTGTFLGIQDVADYSVNHDIKLGDKLNTVWSKLHLEYFRRFSFQGINYFYFEKGIRYEVPYTPNYLFYYKFDNLDNLVEIGFGYGMIGVNPMFQE